MASEKPPSPSQWNPHPTLYRKPFYVVFAVEDTTFGLDVGSLIQHSDPLREILQIEPADGSEGTEKNPIVVNGVTVQRFESFMSWLNHFSWKPPTDLPKEALIDILHMSHMWYIKDGIKFARHWLEQIKIPATERINLAKQYEIRDWVAPAVQDLLKTPLNDLSNSELEQISTRLYCIIAKAKEALERQRKIIAAFPPSLPKDSHDFQTAWCMSHTTCSKVWADTWWRVVARSILHPLDPLDLNNIVDFLKSVDHRGMSIDCKGDMIAWLERGSHFLAPQGILDGAIRSVLLECGFLL